MNSTKSIPSRFRSSLVSPGRLWGPILVAALATTGCIKKTLLHGQIESTRKASEAMQTTADFEVARVAAAGGIAQFEGLHHLAPDHEDGVYLLVRAYASYTFAFVEDEYEIALAGDHEEQADQLKERAKSLYTRAIGFGAQWMESKHPGFSDAVKKGTEEAIAAYVKQFEKASDADILFWTGYSWMARANVTKEAELIGSVYVGRVIIERVLELNDQVERGSGYVLLGAFAARTGVATIGEDSFKQSKAYFDKALHINEGKVLLAYLQMARTYVCRGKDTSPGRLDSFAVYLKTLRDILAADDPLPAARLTNAIAKRRARRYLSEGWIKRVAREDCGWDFSQLPKTAPPSAPEPARADVD